MVRLQIGLAGDQQIDRELLRFTDNIKDLRPAFQRIADQLAEAMRQHFATEGGFGAASRWSGGHWAPLSPKYRLWKEKRYPGQPILVLTGALRRDLTSRPFGVERIGTQSMEVGTDIPYATYHQHGTPKMPMRKPMDLTAEVRQTMVKTLQRYIVSGRV